MSRGNSPHGRTGKWWKGGASWVEMKDGGGCYGSEVVGWEVGLERARGDLEQGHIKVIEG
jgi:hypothetical protein